MAASSLAVRSPSLSRGFEKIIWRTLSIRTWACSVANNSGKERRGRHEMRKRVNFIRTRCFIFPSPHHWWPPASWSPSCRDWTGLQGRPAPSSWAGPAPTPGGPAPSPPAVGRGWWGTGRALQQPKLVLQNWRTKEAGWFIWIGDFDIIEVWPRWLSGDGTHSLALFEAVGWGTTVTANSWLCF